MKLLSDTRQAFLTVFLLCLFAMAVRPATDPDLWWHLRTGQLILQSHSPIHRDPFSFTRFGQPWVNHEWLADVLIYSLYRLAGWGGLIITFAVIITAAYWLVFLRCGGRHYVAALVTAWGAIASVPSWGVRPQMLSLLLASAFLYILERSDAKTRAIWWTLPLMLLWVNLHAGFALGILLMVLFGTGTLLDVALGFRVWHDARRQLKWLATATAVCAALVAVNPNGVRLYTYPLQTLTSRAMQTYIAEWFSPNFHELRFLPFGLLLLAIMAALPFSSRRTRPHDLLLLLVTAFAALRSVRHIPIFVLIAAPVLSTLLEEHMERLRRPSTAGARQPEFKSWKAPIHALIVVAFVAFAATRVAAVTAKQAQAERASFPSGAVSFLLRSDLPRPILNHYNWGGYLIWKLYPRYRVFIDGRADLYGDEFMEELSATYHLTDDWQRALQKWDVRTLVLPPDAPVVAKLLASSGWREVYADPQAVVLSRRN